MVGTDKPSTGADGADPAAADNEDTETDAAVPAEDTTPPRNTERRSDPDVATDAAADVDDPSPEDDSVKARTQAAVEAAKTQATEAATDGVAAVRQRPGRFGAVLGGAVAAVAGVLLARRWRANRSTGRTRRWWVRHC